MGPKIAIAPGSTDELAQAVHDGGGEVVDPPVAEGLVWTNPADPDALGEVLATSSARWVQLPFAGIERFVAAGVIDPARTWTCMKGAYGPACAEHALALMLAAARRLHDHIRATSWRSGGFGSPERRLEGLTVVIVGTAGIGRALVPMLEPLGARMIGVNRSGAPLEGAERTVTAGSLVEVLPDADFVVIAAALTKETHHMLDERAFAAMKPGAWIVNVARGGLVDTDALVAALDGGRLGGAALDVTEPEPLVDGHPLWSEPNVIITPHVANTWDMAIPSLLAQVRRNVALFAAGKPLEGTVDPKLGY